MWSISNGMEWIREDDAGQLTGHPDTVETVRAWTGLTAAYRAPIDGYQPYGPDDPYGWYLIGQRVIPDGRVAGTPPTAPDPSGQAWNTR